MPLAPDLFEYFGKGAASVETIRDAAHLRLPAVLRLTGKFLLCSHVPYQPVLSDGDSQDTRSGANSGPRSCTGRSVHQITLVPKDTAPWSLDEALSPSWAAVRNC